MKKMVLAALFVAVSAQANTTYVTVTTCNGEADHYPDCAQETTEVRSPLSLRKVWEKIKRAADRAGLGKGSRYPDCGWGGEAGHYPECRTTP